MARAASFLKRRSRLFFGRGLCMAGVSKGKAKDRACYQKPSVSHVTHRYVWLLNVLAALIDEKLAQFQKVEFLLLPMSFVSFPSEAYTRSRESAIRPRDIEATR
jgi:hypothetical protein